MTPLTCRYQSTAAGCDPDALSLVSTYTSRMMLNLLSAYWQQTSCDISVYLDLTFPPSQTLGYNIRCHLVTWFCHVHILWVIDKSHRIVRTECWDAIVLVPGTYSILKYDSFGWLEVITNNLQCHCAGFDMYNIHCSQKTAWTPIQYSSTRIKSWRH